MRYEPDEFPEDDYSDTGTGDGMQEQSEGAASSSGEGDSDTTGSLADFLTSDDEVEPDSDAADPDWEMDSSCATDSTGMQEDSDID